MRLRAHREPTRDCSRQMPFAVVMARCVEAPSFALWVGFAVYLNLGIVLLN